MLLRNLHTVLNERRQIATLLEEMKEAMNNSPEPFTISASTDLMLPQMEKWCTFIRTVKGIQAKDNGSLCEKIPRFQDALTAVQVAKQALLEGLQQHHISQRSKIAQHCLDAYHCVKCEATFDFVSGHCWHGFC